MQSFTCLVKKDGNQFASLCIELDVASCGRTQKEAIQGIKNAIETYIDYMTPEHRQHETFRPVPMDALKAFLFPEDAQHEQSVKAISLEFEYA